MKKILILILISIFLNCEKIEFKQSETMAQQDLNYGSAYYDPSADSARITFDKIQDNFDELYAEDVAINSQIGTAIKVKVYINGWDMDTDQTKNVSYTLPVGKVIANLRVMIYPDTGSAAYPLDFTGTDPAAGYYYYTGTEFYLFRSTGSTFDSTSYNDTGVNRGYISFDLEDSGLEP